MTYTQAKPRVVVELDVDTAFEDYRWRHTCRFVRVGRDLKTADLSTPIGSSDAPSGAPSLRTLPDGALPTSPTCLTIRTSVRDSGRGGR